MSYAIEWMGGVVFLVLVALLCAPPLSFLIGFVMLVAIVLAAAAALVALAGALVAAPYLLGRSVRRRWRARTAAGRPRSRGAPARAEGLEAAHQLPVDFPVDLAR